MNHASEMPANGSFQESGKKEKAEMRIARVRTIDGRITLAEMLDDGTLVRLQGDLFLGEFVACEEIEATEWLPPVEPRAILCIGKNYAAHAKEFDGDIPESPVLFMKNPAAATGHLQPVVLPAVCDDEVDYEGELAVIIGKTCRNATLDNALDHVLGYTCANDISARIWQKDRSGGQWIRGKSFDTFAPMGPVLVTADSLDSAALQVRTVLNGNEMQNGNTRDMIFDVPTLISILSQDTTLLPGTVLLTGTPEGVGWARNPKVTLQSGDEVSVSVQGIGTLTNRVVG